MFFKLTGGCGNAGKTAACKSSLSRRANARLSPFAITLLIGRIELFSAIIIRIIMKPVIVFLLFTMGCLISPRALAQQPAGNDFMKKALIVVNGEIVPLSRLDSISPGNIATVEVMKEDAARKQYGEKGKNGVVLITLHNAEPEPALQRRGIAGAFMEKVIIAWDSAGENRGMRLKVAYRDSTDINASHRPDRNVQFYGEGQQPLILLEGREIPYAELQQLDPATFQLVEILKGAEARAAYGEKGKYGVVRIFRKK